MLWATLVNLVFKVGHNVNVAIRGDVPKGNGAMLDFTYKQPFLANADGEGDQVMGKTCYRARQLTFILLHHPQGRTEYEQRTTTTERTTGRRTGATEDDDDDGDGDRTDGGRRRDGRRPSAKSKCSFLLSVYIFVQLSPKITKYTL